VHFFANSSNTGDKEQDHNKQEVAGIPKLLYPGSACCNEGETNKDPSPEDITGLRI